MSVKLHQTSLRFQNLTVINDIDEMTLIWVIRKTLLENPKSAHKIPVVKLSATSMEGSCFFEILILYNLEIMLLPY